MNLIPYNESTCIFITKKDDLDDIGLTPDEVVYRSSKDAQAFVNTIGTLCSKFMNDEDGALGITSNSNGDVAFIYKIFDEDEGESYDTVMDMLDDVTNELCADLTLTDIFNQVNNTSTPPRDLKIDFDSMHDVIDFAKAISGTEIEFSQLVKSKNHYHLLMDYRYDIWRYASEMMYNTTCIREREIFNCETVIDMIIPCGAIAKLANI